jgi:hypothetical protein
MEFVMTWSLSRDWMAVLVALLAVILAKLGIVAGVQW